MIIKNFPELNLVSLAHNQPINVDPLDPDEKDNIDALGLPDRVELVELNDDAQA
ncbi:7400_t:CDS:2 [Entrophospora sp. SA101]|nr:7398_t:CDS:2 [Entrophospora sp. SA101]CAJ0628859.1 7400_t:CDS:2 [Entrophospora sp. SA101]CAJ0841158.1 1872_t:CDS:2 [Entrophospora sp. SA101]CAJ0841170.1 1876_t:CDS:2 [Entrophospora sp. SA101]CAJ0841181.1 1880_t:CDS:2 [Entrophospora sp. SA101]